MSVVAVKRDGAIVTIAADTLCTLSHSTIMQKDSLKLMSLQYPTDNKTKIKNIILGSVGDFTDKYAFQDFFAEIKREDSDLEFTKREHVFELFRAFREWKKQNHLDGSATSYFIIVCDAGIYYYEPDGELHAVNKMYAMGAGAREAFAVMHYGGSAEEAVDVAKDLSTKCGGNTVSFNYRLPMY